MVACMPLDNYFTFDFFLSFCLSIFGHWHSFTHNHPTKPLLPSQKPIKTGSIDSISGNIEINKIFQKLHVNYKLTTI